MRRVRASFVFAALIAIPASAQSVEEWVHGKIAAQRAEIKPTPPTVLGPSGQVWRERATAKPLPGFVPPTSLAPLVKAVRSAVVRIDAQNEGTQLALGSGFLINPDGLVVTNNHVVSKAQQISVQLADGREFEAAVVGRDPGTDVALLRLPGAKDLPTVTLGDSDDLEVGDWVVAIGNPYQLDLSVTNGIISARERSLGKGEYEEFLQTNAQIHPGSSGGPLFDMKGDVIGVTSQIDSRGPGIGFAVPINFVKDLLPNLLENGRPVRGWLGLSIWEVGKGDKRAPIVLEVVSGSPAERAGILPGDRVLSIGGKAMTRREQILRRVALLQPGTAVKIEVVRAGKNVELNATLDQRPSAEARYAMSSAGRIDALGLVLKPLSTTPDTQGTELGLKVSAIKPAGPAEAAGLALGDVVIEVNRELVASLKDVEAGLGLAAPDDEVLLKVRRGQSLRYFAVHPAP